MHDCLCRHGVLELLRQKCKCAITASWWQAWERQLSLQAFLAGSTCAQSAMSIAGRGGQGGGVGDAVGGIRVAEYAAALQRGAPERHGHRLAHARAVQRWPPQHCTWHVRITWACSSSLQVLGEGLVLLCLLRSPLPGLGHLLVPIGGQQRNRAQHCCDAHPREDAPPAVMSAAEDLCQQAQPLNRALTIGQGTLHLAWNAEERRVHWRVPRQITADVRAHAPRADLTEAHRDLMVRYAEQKVDIYR